MKVILAKSAGFCWGVKRAVNMARNLAAQARKSDPSAVIHSDGPLIHNRQMMDLLRTEGVAEAPAGGGIRGLSMLVRAHGVSPDRFKELETQCASLGDATCPDVKSIQALVAERVNSGCDVVIFGNSEHAEVVGLLGHAGKRGFVVERAEDVAILPELSRVCLVSQSTQLPETYRAVAASVRRRFPGAEALDTICRSTKQRGQDVVDMAGDVDVFVVVGDPHSANTLRLAELARGMKPTFHIQTADQVCAEDFRGFGTVGLTAGASTPDFVIAEVLEKLESL